MDFTALALTIVGGLIPIAIISYFVSFGIKGKAPIVKHGISIGIATIITICIGAFGNAEELPPAAKDWANSMIVYMSAGLLYFGIRGATASTRNSKSDNDNKERP
jgi:hypothetical protein